MHHLPGAHQDDVTGLDRHLGELARRVEVVGTDGVPGLEHLAPEGPGDVEQDPRLTTVVSRWMPHRDAPSADDVDAG